MTHQNHYDPVKSPNDMATAVAAYRQSGLSLKEFARERGIRPGRLHYWVYQKNQDAKPRSLVKEPRAGRTAGFQEVKLEAGSALLQSWAAEVSLGRGLNVRFSGTARPDWIGAVVQALQRPC
jgi:transposase-like protein